MGAHGPRELNALEQAIQNLKKTIRDFNDFDVKRIRILESARQRRVRADVEQLEQPDKLIENVKIAAREVLEQYR